MSARKPKFILASEPTIWFKENRIEASVSLSLEEIELLAPRIVGLSDSLMGSGINTRIEAEITIRIVDADLYTGLEDEAAS